MRERERRRFGKGGVQRGGVHNVCMFIYVLMRVCVCVWGGGACKDLHPGTILCF